MNIGYRPTISRNFQSRQIEVHIFGISNDMYDKNIKVSFVKRIRDEIRFDSLDALKEQLKKDEVSAKKILQNEER